MVIGDFDIKSIAVLPAEADSPLIVDGDGVLTETIPLEGVQAVARRHFEVVDGSGQIDIFQSAHGSGKKIRRQTFRVPGRVEELGLLVGERFDHEIA